MNQKIHNVDIPSLEMVYYPDPRLKEVCTPIEDPTDPAVRALTEKMWELMHASRGVGLAGPQVGVTVRLFTACPSAEASDNRVYINPEIVAVDGTQDGEEGCLSFPGVYCKVKRHKKATIRACGLDGEVFEETGEDLLARIFEHESDHLDGRLLTDRMSRVARIANRKLLQSLEEKYTPVS